MNPPSCKVVDPIIKDRQCSCCLNMVGAFPTYVVSQFTRKYDGKQWQFTSCQNCNRRYYGESLKSNPTAFEEHDCRVLVYRTDTGRPVELITKPAGRHKPTVITF